MATLSVTTLSTLTAPHVLPPDPSDGRKRPIKRLQAQWTRNGYTASSFQFVARVDDSHPWVAVGAANTAATGLIELPPYPHWGVVVTTLTGTGNLRITINEP